MLVPTLILKNKNQKQFEIVKEKSLCVVFNKNSVLSENKYAEIYDCLTLFGTITEHFTYFHHVSFADLNKSHQVLVATKSKVEVKKTFLTAL